MWTWLRSLLRPTEEEQRIIKALSDPRNKSCRVVGRGTLVKDPKDCITPEERVEWSKWFADNYCKKHKGVHQGGPCE